VLQGEGGGGHHDGPRVQKGRDQVRQRLAGAGAGLDQQVLAVGQRRLHGVGHGHLTRPFLAAQRRHRPVQHVMHRAASHRPHASRSLLGVMDAIPLRRRPQATVSTDRISDRSFLS
jgi:hypothetical protein